MTQAKGYVDARYLEASAELLQPVKDQSYALMSISPGDVVLDVGCGAGIDTIALARDVGPSGYVFGIDYDADMVEQANDRAKEQGVSAFVEHQQGNADALPIASRMVDACRSERVFMHLSEPGKALAEMVRVTKPGGRIVIVEPDWATASIDTDEVEIERRLMRARAEHLMNNGYAGRQLVGLFKRAGLAALSVKLIPIYFTDYRLSCAIDRLNEVEEGALEANLISELELKRWRKSLRHADETGVFFSSVCLIMVCGRKP